MSLQEYNRKRDFTKTAEPAGAAARDRARAIFVVQEHHASHLHWDFRLEADGLLKSWAVPKEPTMDPAVKRLAVQVEDHPLAYASFTGDIPQGQYGGGHVALWDKGNYENLMEDKPSPMTVAQGVDAGRLEIRMHGKKLRGDFALIRMARGEKKNWLLIKMKDADAKAALRGDGKRGGGKTRPDAAPGGNSKGTASAKGSPSQARADTGKRAAAGKRAAGKSAMVKTVPAKNDTGAPPIVARGEPETVAYTHTDKVMFPEKGFTKGDVLEFYEKIAPRLLPYLHDRPVTLERLPDGLGGKNAPHFWQKNTPAYYPKWVPRVGLPSETGKPVDYALVNDEKTLLYLVNQGAVTFHPFLSRTSRLDTPDFVLFDLDPGEASFADVVAVANALHAILDGGGVKSSIKTSGKSGLHVRVPWDKEGGFDEARAWAMGIAERLVKASPDDATTQRSKSARSGKVYVDVMQNARGHHAAPPFVLRATPGATVSTPLEWEELTATLDPAKWDLKTIFARLRGKKVPAARIAR